MSNKNFNFYLSVKFENNPKAYYFGTYHDGYVVNEYVVVETVRGVELAKVSEKAKSIDALNINGELKAVIRVATKEDRQQYKDNKQLETEAKNTCQNLIDKLKLDMNLLSAEYTLDRSKILFVYVSEDRVDFRELLKMLSSTLKCRIELKQVGARDKAKLVGAIGSCGMETCCSRYKTNFEVISINMAKTQGMALNIEKLSGQCGKLKCCLRYENDMYADARKNTPKLNSYIFYKGKKYRVSELNMITREAKLQDSDEAIRVPFDDAFKDFREKKNEPSKEL